MSANAIHTVMIGRCVLFNKCCRHQDMRGNPKHANDGFAPEMVGESGIIREVWMGPEGPEWNIETSAGRIVITSVCHAGVLFTLVPEGERVARWT